MALIVFFLLGRGGVADSRIFITISVSLSIEKKLYNAHLYED